MKAVKQNFWIDYTISDSFIHEINVSHNILTALPVGIETLKCLTNLDVSHNELTSLPSQLGGLKYLNNFDASHNKLVSISILVLSS